MTQPLRSPLSQTRLSQTLLPGSHLWTKIGVTEITDSTNADVLEHAKAGTAAGFVWCAESQRQGRGRLNRAWSSPPRAGIAVSLLLRPTAPNHRWGLLSLLTAVALGETLRHTAGITASLKWPNDILVSSPDSLTDMRKCSGILAWGGSDAVIMGIGLNVSLTTEELPRDDATSLYLAGAHTLDRTELLADFLTRFERHYLAWEQHAGDGESSQILPQWRAHSATLGQEVNVTFPDGSHKVGLARDVNRDGQLVLKYDQKYETVSAGDITHLRPKNG